MPFHLEGSLFRRRAAPGAVLLSNSGFELLTSVSRPQRLATLSSQVGSGTEGVAQGRWYRGSCISLPCPSSASPSPTPASGCPRLPADVFSSRIAWSSRWSFVPFAQKQQPPLLAGKGEGANSQITQKALVMGTRHGMGVGGGGSTGWAILQ